MENEKKIKRYRTGCMIMMIAGVLFGVLWFIMAAIFLDSMPDQVSGLIGIAVMLIFFLPAVLLNVKANKLSPIITTQATVTERKVKAGNPNRYIVCFVRENGESFSLSWDRQLYDAVQIGERGLLTTQGDSVLSFGDWSRK